MEVLFCAVMLRLKGEMKEWFRIYQQRHECLGKIESTMAYYDDLLIFTHNYFY